MKKFFFLFILCSLMTTLAVAENFPSELKNKLIGVQLGTTGDIMVSDIKDVRIERYNKANDAVQSLINEKIDAVVIDEQPALTFVQKNAGLKILEREFAKEEYAIALSKKNKALKNQINGILSELKSDGTIDRIVQNYIGENKGQFPFKLSLNEKYNKIKLLSLFARSR